LNAEKDKISFVPTVSPKRKTILVQCRSKEKASGNVIHWQFKLANVPLVQNFVVVKRYDTNGKEYTTVPP